MAPTHYALRVGSHARKLPRPCRSVLRSPGPTQRRRLRYRRRERGREAIMQKFLATVEFEFESDSLKSAGHRMETLSQAARAAGFDLKRAKAEPLRESYARDDTSGSIKYTP